VTADIAEHMGGLGDGPPRKINAAEKENTILVQNYKAVEDRIAADFWPSMRLMGLLGGD